MKTTTFELELPRNMRPMARAAFKALDGDGCLFEHNGRLVMTDESGDLEEHGDGTPGNPWGCPRWIGDSFAELEDWLVQCAADWIAEGPNDPMFQALEEAFESAR